MIMFSPQNKAAKVPKIKNGANGTSLFKPFLPKIIKAKLIIAPRIKAKNNPTKIPGNPKINPSRIANFTSPKPIHLPLDKRKSAKKKTDARKAAPIKI